jgi:hypothetical protein
MLRPNPSCVPLLQTPQIHWEVPQNIQRNRSECLAWAPLAPLAPSSERQGRCQQPQPDDQQHYRTGGASHHSTSPCYAEWHQGHQSKQGQRRHTKIKGSDQPYRPQWPGALAEESRPLCDQRRQITVPTSAFGAHVMRMGDAWTLARGAGGRCRGGGATTGVVFPIRAAHNSTPSATEGAATALA